MPGARQDRLADGQCTPHHSAAGALQPAFRKLTADLGQDYEGCPYSLHIANAIWGQKGVEFCRRLSKSQKKTLARLQGSRFRFRPEQARKIINRWAEEQTKDKSKELLDDRDVDKKTRHIVADAVYFKEDDWSPPFHRTEEKEIAFAVSATKKKMVPAMTVEGFFPYHASDDFKIVEVNFVGRNDRGSLYSMVVLLPATRTGWPRRPIICPP